MNRRVCIVTGSRAELGLLRQLIVELAESEKLDLQLVVTGMHLSPEFGLTYQEIVDDGVAIDAKVEMLLSSDTRTAVTKSMGLGVIGFADAYERLAPDIVVVLGDRFEVFAAASAAMIAGIPLAHVHGGEATEGAFDDVIRHSITKMSHLHFVAADEYRQRVIQMGEHPETVFNFGGLGIDAIKRIKLLERRELESSLKLSFREKNLLVTFHPVTREGAGSSATQLGELLAALDELRDTALIFTMPNADTEGRELGTMVREFVKGRSNAQVYTSLGQLRYFSCMAQVDGVVGNSSSGLSEAPSFKIGSINIGDRQKGRLKASSVIDCEPKQQAIQEALNMLYAADFRASLATVSNPYGNGGATEAIVRVLADYPLEDICKKSFYNFSKNEIS